MPFGKWDHRPYMKEGLLITRATERYKQLKSCYNSITFKGSDINMEKRNPYIQTERLVLRDFNEKDLAGFYNYRTDKKLCRFQDFSLASQKELYDFYTDQLGVKIGATEWKQLAIASHDGLLMGDCAIKRNEYESRIAEIGITLDWPYHGAGYAKEAISGLVSYAFDKLELHKIVAVVDIRNIASRRLFESLSFTLEGRFRKHYWDKIDNEWFDELHFGLLSTDI